MILGKIPEIEEAVDAGIVEWANPAGVNYSVEDIDDFLNLRNIIVRWVSQTETVRELRALRYRVKQLGKQAGKQGDQIYNLRCRLTEVQSLTLMDRNTVRQLRDRSYTALGRNRDLAEENAELRLSVAELTEELEQESDDIEGLQRANQILLERALTAEAEVNQLRNQRDTAKVGAADAALAKAYGC